MRNRQNLHKPHNNQVHRWTVSYADYMTLMFALFVVLYAVSLNKEEKYHEIIEAIQASSQFLYTDNSGSEAKGILTKRSNDIKDDTGPALLSDGDNYQLGHVSELPSEQLSNLEQYYTGEPLAALQLSLHSALESDLETGAFSVDLEGDWLTIEMSGPLLFAVESHTLLNAAKQKVDRVGRVLSTVNNMIRLRGYTDLTPISNEIYQSNWELSSLRAISVLHALNDLGVVGERMVIEGFGSFQPVLNENGLVDEAKSRRVVIAISKFALQPTKKVENISVDSEVKTPKENEIIPVSDSETMQEIYLPDGRLIITTRQELE
ncbi:OmpA family protein [Psychromonas sp.]|nr:OmpA family protein [Psychromonas sp.]